jgi:hypothetical protein
MKKVIAISIALMSIVPLSAHADSNKTIAIIDTGYISSILQFQGKISYEACFNGLLPTCPNGKYFQEGTGSAAITSEQAKIGMASHGTEMLSASINTNPTTNFVYIRAYSISANNIFGPSDSDLASILNWLYANNNKFNIGAVVFSGGRNVTSCPTNTAISKSVSDFKSLNIPVIMSAGNDYNNNIVNFPSCLTQVISVGSVDKFGLHALYSNSGLGLDFDALGSISVTNYAGNQVISTGTSAAAQVFTAQWMAIKQAKQGITYDQEYSLIQKNAALVSNQYVKNVPSISLSAILK